MRSTQTYQHIIIPTKMQEQALLRASRPLLLNYLWHVLHNLDCQLIQFNGAEDHVHLLVKVAPTLSLNEVMTKLINSSSYWMTENENFPGFSGWSEEWISFEVSSSDKQAASNYINNQDRIHKRESYFEELSRLILQSDSPQSDPVSSVG